MGIIKKSFTFLDEDTLPLFFKSLVRPHLEYGNVIWGPFYKGDAEDVERLQRRATKGVPGLSSLTYEERLRKLKLPSLQHRRRRGDMIMTYKIITGKVNLKKDEVFTFAANQTNRKSHQYKLARTKATKSARQNALSIRVVDDWNNLPAKIVASESTDTFKRLLDEHWESEMYRTPF